MTDVQDAAFMMETSKDFYDGYMYGEAERVALAMENDRLRHMLRQAGFNAD